MLWRSLALCGLALTLAPCAQAAEPIEGKTVYIDAGHGGEDSGAVGNGLFEKDINLAVSEHVTDKLKEEGANPVASRSDDHFLTLEERVAKASANQADLFVSIHVNSGVASASGTETYFQSDYEGENSRRLASDIQSQLVSSLQTRDRGVKESDFYVITYSQMCLCCLSGKWVLRLSENFSSSFGTASSLRKRWPRGNSHSTISVLVPSLK